VIYLSSPEISAAYGLAAEAGVMMLPDSTDKISKEITRNGKKLLELMPSSHSNDWFNDGWEDHTITFSIILGLILSFHGDSELNSAILTWQRQHFSTTK
jgi:hypothetical protein